MTPKKIVVIGSSWGGLSALSELLLPLRDDFPAAIVVAQHRHADSSLGLERFLKRHTSLAVREADDKDPLEPGTVFLAPADYHLLVEDDHLALSVDGPEMFSRPSADVLFESAAATYRERVIGVVLTGANEDGARGLRSIRAAGGTTIVQDPATAERSEMPDAALVACPSSLVLNLGEMGPLLNELCQAVRVTK
ncbi:MAG TPA: chemotaxis protein CheB [Actinomycetota bacterium]|nr:chemotaxis protein CheB [Actinomycetota bacterium]